ncbi:hypothetical protein ACOSQ2_012347 [Xanthoceras sorbifolium]
MAQLWAEAVELLLMLEFPPALMLIQNISRLSPFSHEDNVLNKLDYIDESLRDCSSVLSLDLSFIRSSYFSNHRNLILGFANHCHPVILLGTALVATPVDMNGSLTYADTPVES